MPFQDLPEGRLDLSYDELTALVRRGRAERSDELAALIRHAMARLSATLRAWRPFAPPPRLGHR